jgi:hypothetical protein
MYRNPHLLFSYDVRIQPFVLRQVFKIMNIVLTIHRIDTGLLAHEPLCLETVRSIDSIIFTVLIRMYACRAAGSAIATLWRSILNGCRYLATVRPGQLPIFTNFRSKPGDSSAIGPCRARCCQTRGEHLMPDANGTCGTVQVVGFRHVHVGLGP